MGMEGWREGGEGEEEGEEKKRTRRHKY
jgi:hypothetical protein